MSGVRAEAAGQLIGMMGSLPIERLSTAERVAAALRDELLSGAILPGTPMRDIELSARAGVSRTTVREALSLLAREGLLTHSLHRGTEVARLAPDDVRDIYAMRRILERAGAEALIASPSAGIEDLERAVAAMAGATARRDRRGVVEADVAFHSAIVATLGNRRIYSAMTGAMKELRLALSVTDRTYDDLDWQLSQHQSLLALLRERNPDAAQALEEHLAHSEAMVCMAVERPSARSDVTHRHVKAESIDDHRATGVNGQGHVGSPTRTGIERSRSR
jgi:DNA-binding GntR family transcriptional regulator